VETSPGNYSIAIEPLWYDGTGYTIRIFAEKANFALEESYYESQVVQVPNPDREFMEFLMTVLPPTGGLVVGIIVLLTGRVVYARKKRAEFAVDVANQQRFDDADNIIGVIVLHKKSGIPIYSKMMKGGFEEGIVAAFITAVTHFREEFEMFDAEAMNVIPISDIIRAVQTRNLICAFITVKSASIEHNRKMETYGKQVGTYLDDLLDEMSSGVADPKITDMLDYIFHTTMDGFLLKYYKVATSEKFPDRYRQLDEIMRDSEMRHCTKPVLLARSVMSLGVTEARGCTLVLEAIEKELLVLCEEHETEVPEVDFSDFFSKPDRVPSSGSSEP